MRTKPRIVVIAVLLLIALTLFGTWTAVVTGTPINIVIGFFGGMWLWSWVMRAWREAE